MRRAASRYLNQMHLPSSARIWGLLIAWVALLPVSARCAEPEFVGLLAWLTDAETAKSLNISEQQQTGLEKVIDDRETAALELALELKDAPEAERVAKLAPFRQESEQQGIALLDHVQQRALAVLAMKRLGLASLGNETFAEIWGLTGDQRERVTRTLADQAPATNADQRAALDRALAEHLTFAQRQAIQQGEPGGKPAVAATDKPAEPDSGAASTSTAKTTEATTPGEPPAPQEPATPRTAAVKPVATLPKDGKLYFGFRYQPWKEVLDWFAEQAQLSLTISEIPEGTFNYVDSRGYTPSEALDVLNSILLTKGYTLVQHQRMLILANIANGIPANLVPPVALEDLDKRGDHELVSVLFPLQKLSAAEAETEIKKLLGPQGSIVTLPKAQQIQVTETAGRLRTIRRVIEAVEGPADGEGELRQFVLQHVSAEEALPVVRKLLNIPDETNAAADGSLRLAADLSGRTILATGKEHRLVQLEEILKKIDVGSDLPLAGGPLESPQLEIYSVATSDPAAVLQVLQTLMAGQADVRLAIDGKTGNVIALARPSQQATIRATIAQMQRDGRRIEAFPLRKVDPQIAVLAINKLFGVSAEGPAPASAPTVDADPLSRTLLVRASDAQLEQIRDLLHKMGEVGGAEGEGLAGESARGNVRVLPLSGRAARSAIEQMEQIWPTVRRNKIRIVTPSATGAVRGLPDFTTPNFNPIGTGDRSKRPQENAPRSEKGEQNPADESLPDPADSERPANPATGGSGIGSKAPADRSTQILPQPSRVPARFASEQVPLPEETKNAASAEESTAQQPPAESDSAAEADSPALPSVADSEPAEILVSPGPTGTVIVSEDVAALDEFEELLTAMASRTASGREFAVFYLKHAKAVQAAETLRQIFGGGDSGGGGGGLMGDLAGAALGDMGGGLLGSLLGGGGGGGDSGTISGSVGAIDIVPDTRLNALITRGKPADLDTLEQLLQIIDQVESPEEVAAAPKARLIPVYNTSAEEIADVVRQVYSERIAGTGGNGGQRPSPQDFIRALRGGRDRGGNGANTAEDTQKMSIGVDARSNSLIVSAPQALFDEVSSLVKQLDQGGSDTGETTKVVTLKRSNPQAVSKALASVLGPSVTTNTSGVQSQANNNSNNSGRNPRGGNFSQGRGQSSQGPPNFDPAEFQQRIEFMNQLRESMRGGGGQGGGFGGGRSGGGGRSRGEGGR